MAFSIMPNQKSKSPVADKNKFFVGVQLLAGLMSGQNPDKMVDHYINPNTRTPSGDASGVSNLAKQLRNNGYKDDEIVRGLINKLLPDSDDIKTIKDMLSQGVSVKEAANYLWSQKASQGDVKAIKGYYDEPERLKEIQAAKGQEQADYEKWQKPEWLYENQGEPPETRGYSQNARDAWAAGEQPTNVVPQDAKTQWRDEVLSNYEPDAAQNILSRQNQMEERETAETASRQEKETSKQAAAEEKRNQSAARLAKFAEATFDLNQGDMAGFLQDMATKKGVPYKDGSELFKRIKESRSQSGGQADAASPGMQMYNQMRGGMVPVVNPEEEEQ